MAEDDLNQYLTQEERDAGITMVDPFEYMDALDTLTYWYGWLDHILQQTVPEVIIFDRENIDSLPGKLLKSEETDNGVQVTYHEYAIEVQATKKSNLTNRGRGRVLMTIRSLLRNELPKKNWQSIGLESNDQDLMDSAWAEAKLIGLPVLDQWTNDNAMKYFDRLLDAAIK